MNIQVLEIPGIIRGAASGKGMGRKILSIARGADLILILLDVFQPDHLGAIEKELYAAGIRINQDPPRVSIKKTGRGGVNLVSNIELTKLDEETVRSVLNVNGIHNAHVIIHEDVDVNQFIDVVMGNRIYIPSLVIQNKVDMVERHGKHANNMFAKLNANINREFIPISAENATNLEKVREEIFKKLNLIRIYLKPQRGKPDYEEPMIVRRGSRIGDICNKLHRDFKDKFRYAKIWGTSVKFGGQKKGLEHVLYDRDVLTIIKDK